MRLHVEQIYSESEFPKQILYNSQLACNNHKESL